MTECGVFVVFSHMKFTNTQTHATDTISNTSMVALAKKH